MSLGQLERIRRFELVQIEALVRKFAPAGSRLLDIGAGTGWAAQHFGAAGYDVMAIDLPTSVYVDDRVFPITEYDGHRIPADDNTFDLIYSSNVLEHVAHADAFQREILRVLKPTGVAIHVVPSGSWRIHSNLTHYPHILKRAVLMAMGKGEPDVEVNDGHNAQTQAPSKGRDWGKILFPAPDGEVGNALTEMWHFSRWRWQSLFENNGWQIRSRESNKLYYTAKYLLGEALSIEARSALSAVTGGACHVFVVEPIKHQDGARKGHSIGASETAPSALLSSTSNKDRASAQANPRVLLVGPAFTGGGAEHRFARAAKFMLQGSTDVAVLKHCNEDIGHNEVVDLKRRNLASYPRMALVLRRLTQRKGYEALMGFGFYPNLLAWLASMGLRNPPARIFTEVNSPRREHLYEAGTLRGEIVDWFRKRIYKAADLFAANSIDGINDAIRYYGVDPKRTRRLPNLAEKGQIVALAEAANDRLDDTIPSICIVTRLEARKRVDTLIKAASRLPQDLPWRVDVIGDGSDAGTLKQMVADAGLSDRFVFHGWLKNPHRLVSRAKASVLCSEYEGFSNSVLEAMLVGAPVVTTRCTSDAAEMVAVGAALGFEVGDDSALAGHLLALLTDQGLAKSLTDRAAIYAKAHEMPEAIIAYDRLVFDALALRFKPQLA